MKAIMVLFDSLNRHLLEPYGCDWTKTPNFQRLSRHTVTFDQFYAGSLPCMPARRELHTGRYNFLHRAWGPLENYDDSMPGILREHGIYTHLVTDHWHYWEEGGANYLNKYNSYEMARGQEGDPWKGRVSFDVPKALDGRKDNSGRQEYINREYMKAEEDHPISVTFRNGIQFLEENWQEDNWMLQIDEYDPHEPFFSTDKYEDLYPHEYSGPLFDWPGYHPVRETPEQVQHCRYEYAALLSMCDTYLGKILDLMDRHDMWKDTMLIVHTDHGFLLSEHNWWGKIMMPYYNEIAHIPFFIWDPRLGLKGERCSQIAQTIDIAPTILDFFGIEAPKDMQGKSLYHILKDNAKIRDYALFGQHGLHVNITDGRYVYMKAPRMDLKYDDYNYMLIPNSYPDLVSSEMLSSATLHPPFSFTKGVPLMRIRGGSMVQIPGCPPDELFDNDLFFDLEEDPSQNTTAINPTEERRLRDAMIKMMHENDAPRDQYERVGLTAPADAG